jgi:hypothetical protein
VRGAALETSQAAPRAPRAPPSRSRPRAGRAVADDDNRLWAVAADLATLGDVVQELIDREIFPTNAAPVVDERAASNNPTPQ